MTLTKLLLTLHLLGAFALAAGVTLRLIGARMFEADGSAENNATAGSLLRGPGALLYRGGATLAFLAGMGLVSRTHHSFGDFWISASMMVWILLFVTGDGFTNRHARFLESAAAGGDTQQRVGSVRTTASLEVVLVALLLILMVWQP